MAERDSLWVTGIIDQEEARVGTGAFLVPSTNAVKAKTGLRPGAAAAGQVTATGTPDGFVHVAPFQAFLQSGRGTTAGVYVLTLDTTKDINILSTPAHASLGRRDLIIAHQADTFYGDGSSAMTVRQVVGTPSGSPADPSLASFPDCIQLARVQVDAAATTITSGKITDLRPALTVALGGLLPVASQSLRNALTATYDGMPIYRTDRDWVEIYDGSAWRVQGVAVCSSTSDMSSAITSPYTGQLAVDTTTGVYYRYTGSAWKMATPYRVSTLLGSPAASITFSSIPTAIRLLEVGWTARSTAAALANFMYMRVNNDSTSGHYATNLTVVQNVTSAPAVSTGGTDRLAVGLMAAASAAANIYGSGSISIPGWNAPHANPNMNFRSHMYENAANSYHVQGGGLFFAASPYNRLDFFPESGSFAAGTEITLTGLE